MTFDNDEIKGAVCLVSLGCAKNLVDSELTLARLATSGWAITSEPEEADVIVVNTCAFIEAAREEAYTVIDDYLEFKRSGVARIFAVTGCLPQYEKEGLLKKLPEVDFFLGPADFPRLAELLDREPGRRRLFLGDGSYIAGDDPRLLATPPGSAYLKVSDGCDHRCSFCTIPSIRGEYRSRSLEDLINEAADLIAMGSVEINMIGQDVTAYGADMPGGRRNLIRLLEGLCELEGLSWLRLLYCYPGKFPDRFFELLADSGPLLPYLDLPIQHISDRVLRSMQRGTSEKTIRTLLERLHREVDGITLRTSLIVGYPNETEKDFQKLYDFIAEGWFARLGVFTYSAEPGTAADRLGDGVPEEIKLERADAIAELAESRALAANKKLIGTTVAALVAGEEPDAPGVIVARTAAMAPEVDGAVIINKGRPPEGEIVKLKITDAGAFDLYAEYIE